MSDNIDPREQAIAASENSDLLAQIVTLEREREILRLRLKKTEKQLAEGLNLRQEVFRLPEIELTPPAWTLRSDLHSTGESVPILMFSDAQWGESISARELDGINAFNIEIAQDRYRMMIEKTIDLSNHHMGSKLVFPCIYYLRGGDMISGNIHQELRETNELLAIPSVKSLVESELWGIRQLKRKFGRVVVKTVAGNHGRDTIKPMAKGFADSNYDTLSSWWLEMACNMDPELSGHVQFQTATSPDIVFRLYGLTFLLTHGDRMGSRGGEGFIGPAATIARGMKRIIDEYAALGVVIDHVIIGHFHTSLELEYGWCNGSLPGYSEYAKSGRMRPSQPSQWLLFVHPKHGVSARWKLYLGPKPRLNV